MAMLSLLPPPRATAPDAGATVASPRPAVILPVAPSSPFSRVRAFIPCLHACLTRGVCRRSGAGPREQHGRLRAARGDAAGRPRPPGGRRGSGRQARLAPQRRRPRRRQLLAGHTPSPPRPRLVPEKGGRSGVSSEGTVRSRPPPKGVPGVIDQTRGLLNYVEKNCAPAVYTPELRYVCIAGRYIQGASLLGNSAVSPDEILAVDTPSDVGEAVMIGTNDNSTPSGATWRARFIGQGYKQVCGRADVWGDGVVPEMSAHLEGALNISFDGVYHSPVGSDDEQRPWYGSPAILTQWMRHLLS